MSYRILDHPEALADYADQADYLEAQSDGLGDRFIDLAEAALDDILADPDGWVRVPYWDEEPVLYWHRVKALPHPRRLLHRRRDHPSHRLRTRSPRSRLLAPPPAELARVAALAQQAPKMRRAASPRATPSFASRNPPTCLRKSRTRRVTYR